MQINQNHIFYILSCWPIKSKMRNIQHKCCLYNRDVFISSNEQTLYYILQLDYLLAFTKYKLDDDP
jgi:hypothetical protein